MSLNSTTFMGENQMIKLNANVSKKVPIPDMEYSSQNFSAGMEIEVSSNISKGELKDKYRELYRVLSESIREQLAEASISSSQMPQPQNHNTRRHQQVHSGGNGRGGNGYGSNGHVGNGHGGNGHGGKNGNGNGKKATDAQVRAIYAIANSKGLDKQRIQNMLSESYGVSYPNQLHIGDASSLIDQLKNGG